MSKTVIACFGAWCAQLYLVIALPQVADEAYYQRWGELLSIGYLDHPPGIALWSMGGGRWLNLCLLPFAWVLLGSAARRLGSHVPLSLFLCTAWCTPLGLASGVLVTPDAPLLLSWSIAVFGYASRSVLITAGGLALGLWSKAMIIPAAIGLLWLWWTDPRRTVRRRRVEVSITLLIAVLLYIPHLFWSVTHQGLPWSFQGGRPLRLFSTPEMLAGQLWVGGGLWTWYLLRCYWIKIQSLWSERSASIDRIFSERERQWFWLSAPSLLLWLLISVGSRVEPNWTALAWPFGLIWVLEILSEPQRQRALKVSLCITAPCLCLPLAHQLIPLGWGPPRDGQRLAECVTDSTEHLETSAWVVGRYQEAALLSLPLEMNVRSSFVERITPSVIPLLRYQRPSERRRSQYDLSRGESILPLPCDAVWLGPLQWPEERCRAEAIPISEQDWRCRLKLSRCVCDSESVPPKTPSEQRSMERP